MFCITLVGEQPIPILMPLWQLKGITDLQFVASSKTEEVAIRLEGIVKSDDALKGIQVHDRLLVYAYNLTDTQQKVSQAIYNHQNHHRVLVNLTSGTKIMSLGCLQAVQTLDAQLVYVSTETRELLFFHPASKKEWAERFDIAIDCYQYFNAHGFDASLNHNFRSPYPSIMPPKEGDELENTIYQLCQESSLFDHVQKNLYVRKRLPDQVGVINELDIVCIRNGSLAICSCKSGKLSNDPLYELSSLASRELAGIYCKKFLITSLNDVAIPIAINDRAMSLGIQIISQENLQQSAQIIFDSIK